MFKTNVSKINGSDSAHNLHTQTMLKGICFKRIIKIFIKSHLVKKVENELLDFVWVSLLLCNTILNESFFPCVDVVFKTAFCECLIPLLCKCNRRLFYKHLSSDTFE